MTIRIKICGLTDPAQAIVAAKAGADAVGIVFYPPSSRYVEKNDRARAIAQAAGPLMTVVGLFVNPTFDEVETVLAEVPLQVLQFHGDETAAFCEQFRRPYIKALAVRDDVDLDARIADYPSASGILLDTYKKGVPGGTGETFNWDRFPHRVERPLILAGGLTPDNVRQAIAATRPYAVDVSGGVESTPGQKDPLKVKAFIENVKLGALE